MKRYHVVAVRHKNHEPKGQPSSVYVLVSDSTPGKLDDVKFLEADIDEAIDAFRQGWIDLGSEICQSAIGRCKAAPHSAKPNYFPVQK